MYKKGDFLKLKDGREVKVVNLPTSFMANGSYEIIDKGQKKWIKPEEILYQIDLNWKDDLSLYFEVIQDDSGINIIPKNLNLINIEIDKSQNKIIKFELTKGRKHNTINLHIGETEIKDLNSVTTRPIKKKKGKIKKIIDIIKDDESGE